MNFEALKALFAEIDNETKDIKGMYASKSTLHKAASEIIDLERLSHYGESNDSQLLSKVKNIIFKYSKEINDNEVS